MVTTSTIRVQLAVNGVPVVNGLYDFDVPILGGAAPHYGQATLNLNAGDIVTLVNASGFPIQVLSLSPSAVATTLKMTKFN